MLTLRPLLLAVHRSRSWHAAQADLGKRTVLPRVNGMAVVLTNNKVFKVYGREAVWSLSA